jgi:hypothetical protein
MVGVGALQDQIELDLMRHAVHRQVAEHPRGVLVEWFDPR